MTGLNNQPAFRLLMAASKPSSIPAAIPFIAVLTILQGVWALVTWLFLFSNNPDLTSYLPYFDDPVIALTSLAQLSFILYDLPFAFIAFLLGAYCTGLKKWAFKKNRQFQKTSLAILLLIYSTMVAYFVSSIGIEGSLLTDAIWSLLMFKSFTVIVGPVIVLLMHDPQVESYYQN